MRIAYSSTSTPFIQSPPSPPPNLHPSPDIDAYYSNITTQYSNHTCVLHDTHQQMRNEQYTYSKCVFSLTITTAMF